MLRTIQYIPGAVWTEDEKKKKKDTHTKEVRYCLLILGNNIREKKQDI